MSVANLMVVLKTFDLIGSGFRDMASVIDNIKTSDRSGLVTGFNW